MLTDGTEERQFLHCDDCAECLVALMDRYEILDDVTDVSSFEWTSIREIADLISPKVICGDIVSPNIKNEPRRNVLEFWKPTISLKCHLTEDVNILSHKINGCMPFTD